MVGQWRAVRRQERVRVAWFASDCSFPLYSGTSHAPPPADSSLRKRRSGPWGSHLQKANRTYGASNYPTKTLLIFTFRSRACTTNSMTSPRSLVTNHAYSTSALVGCPSAGGGHAAPFSPQQHDTHPTCITTGLTVQGQGRAGQGKQSSAEKRRRRDKRCVKLKQMTGPDAN